MTKAQMKKRIEELDKQNTYLISENDGYASENRKLHAQIVELNELYKIASEERNAALKKQYDLLTELVKLTHRGLDNPGGDPLLKGKL